MSKSSLFQLADVKNHPRRSAFDMDRKVCFTAKPGEILPIDWTFVLPGDKAKLGIQSFTRTAPVQTCAFQRIKEYYEWFYVPIRQLWRFGGEALMSMQSQLNTANGMDTPFNVGTSSPFLKTSTLESAIWLLHGKKNVFGFDRSVLASKLLSYLRYGGQFKSFSNKASRELLTASESVSVNMLPLLAYHKFYYDHFRNPQWEMKKPQLFNVDYFAGAGVLPWDFTSGYFDKYPTSLLDIHYCNWQKDMFFGTMPSSQFGSVSSVEVDVNPGSSKVAPLMVKDNTHSPREVKTAASFPLPSGSSAIAAKGTSGMILSNEPLYSNIDLSGVTASFSVLKLRAAEALQRWKEITQAGDQSYVGQLYAHFGVKAPKELNNESTRLCGTSSNIVISEIVNQNLVDSPADIRGKGQGSCDDSMGTYEFKEHGVLMCLYHCVPLLDYDLQAPDPLLITTNSTTSFPIPELDNIGLEEVPTRFLSLDKHYSEIFKKIPRLGYAPRFLPWKTCTDLVLGGFDALNTDLYSWVAPINNDFLKQYFRPNGEEGILAMTHYWFKVNPKLLDNIFAVVSTSACGTDPLRVNCQLEKTVIRNLDYDGMPY